MTLPEFQPAEWFAPYPQQVLVRRVWERHHRDNVGEWPLASPEGEATRFAVESVLSCFDAVECIDHRFEWVDGCEACWTLHYVGEEPPVYVERRCHLCGKVKKATTEATANYLLAFHMDRRHRGWTQQPPPSAEPARA